MSWPDTLRINAWTSDGPAVGPRSTKATAWALRDKPRRYSQLMAPGKPADRSNWRHCRVGWGLILPHNDALDAADLAAAVDAPEPIRQLLAARPGSPVFRYIPDAADNLTYLYQPGADKEPMIGQPDVGLAPGAIPRYLLICATPEQIPWEFQYVLHNHYYVGRLALPDEGLDRYVRRLIDDWSGAASRVEQPLAWAVNHGPDDITALMRDLVAARIHAAWESDDELRGNTRFLDGAGGGSDATPSATAQTLIDTLVERTPALVITTSHGQTGPLNDPAAMAAALGLLVDQDGAMVAPDDLLATWQPDGVVWYAHACCSAGSDGTTSYDGLVDAGSPVDEVLRAVAALGSRVAPLPTALLGAEKPARAFIGHVEPTFDWTLRQPETGQPLTGNVPTAFYNNLYLRQPVGMAFHTRYDPLGTLRAQYDRNFGKRNKSQDPDETERLTTSMGLASLLARDLESMVLLGDPTAALPALPGLSHTDAG